MFVVVFGDPFNGGYISGPFETEDEVQFYVEGSYGWTMFELMPPSNRNEGGIGC